MMGRWHVFMRVCGVVAVCVSVFAAIGILTSGDNLSWGTGGVEGLLVCAGIGGLGVWAIRVAVKYPHRPGAPKDG